MRSADELPSWRKVRRELGLVWAVCGHPSQVKVGPVEVWNRSRGVAEIVGVAAVGNSFEWGGSYLRYGYLEALASPAPRGPSVRQRVTCPDCGQTKTIFRTPESVGVRGAGPLVLCWWCLPPGDEEVRSYVCRRRFCRSLPPASWLRWKEGSARQRALGGATFVEEDPAWPGRYRQLVRELLRTS